MPDLDTFESDMIITRRAEPYVDPRPILFRCAICERDVFENPWRADGRSRPIAPFCLACEMAYGGTNLSTWPGPKMDARIARQVKAAAEYLGCLAYRKTHKGGHNGA